MSLFLTLKHLIISMVFTLILINTYVSSMNLIMIKLIVLSLRDAEGSNPFSIPGPYGPIIHLIN